MKESHNEIKKSFEDEFKIIQREYITILGIFSSIILAFVGGITFSNSIFENFNKGSIYRLVLVICLLSFILLNTINLLTTFIKNINQSTSSQHSVTFLSFQRRHISQPSDKNSTIKAINIILLVIVILIILAWACDVIKLQDFLCNKYIPWNK